MEGTTMSDMRRMMMMFTRPVESSSDTVPNPTISPSAGAILPTQTISISISGIATSAEYSFDNQTWTTYSSPFTLSSATTVYARATDGNGNYSNVVSNAYTLLYDAKVEYLQSSGSQYIQLPMTVAKGTAFSVSGIIIAVYNNTSKYSIFSGTPYNQFEAKFYQRNTSNNTITYDSTIGTVSANGGWTASIGSETEFGLSTLGKTVNGVFYELSRPLTANITNFRLFGGYRNNNRYPVKFRSFKVVAGTTTLYDLIAVRKGNVGYMYDTVSGELFGNSGSGSFTLGNDVTT